jgi:hypothetical protein
LIHGSVKCFGEEEYLPAKGCWGGFDFVGPLKYYKREVNSLGGDDFIFTRGADSLENID